MSYFIIIIVIFLKVKCQIMNDFVFSFILVGLSNCTIFWLRFFVCLFVAPDLNDCDSFDFMQFPISHKSKVISTTWFLFHFHSLLLQLFLSPNKNVVIWYRALSLNFHFSARRFRSAEFHTWSTLRVLEQSLHLFLRSYSYFNHSAYASISSFDHTGYRPSF